ncbi:MAG: DUF6668 family protein [Nocardioides sp.]|uniref:DUF6668 family protein n=1 Tax=Nocardioides sp. TaxID=35761 RepID=UPI003D6B1D92
MTDDPDEKTRINPIRRQQLQPQPPAEEQSSSWQAGVVANQERVAREDAERRARLAAESEAARGPRRRGSAWLSAALGRTDDSRAGSWPPAWARTQPSTPGDEGAVVPRSTASSAAGNVFLPVPAEQAIEDGEDDRRAVMNAGPPAPTGAPAPADPVLLVPDRFMIRTLSSEVTVQLVGLHGGAGTSTMASLLGSEAADCGKSLSGLADPTIPVIFVARTHAKGLNLVRRAANQWASGGLEEIRLLGVVFVDDAPNLSKLLARDLRSAERALPHSWRLEWSEDIRHGIHLPGEAPGGRARRTRKSLLDQARKLRASSPSATTNLMKTQQRRGTAS